MTVSELTAEQMKELKPLAAYTISSNISIAIYATEHGINDRVLLGFQGVEKEFRKTWHTIKYTGKGNPFVVKWGKRYLLDNFIKL